MNLRHTTDHKPPTVLLGLTTTPGSDWRAKIKEVDKLGIQEVALFPTCLDPKERPELYALLEKTNLKRIPHVHIRGDFDTKEIEYLIQSYQTEVFNIHPDHRGIKGLGRISKYKDQIYLENLEDNIREIETNIGNCAGLCIDFSHWEAAKANKAESYDRFLKLAENEKIGCCHISAILDKPEWIDWGKGPKLTYSWHLMHKLSELEYIKKYLNFLPDLISIELENSLEEQLKIKEYIEKLISSKQ